MKPVFHRWSPQPGLVVFYQQSSDIAISAADIMVSAGQIAESIDQLGYAHMVASIYDRGSESLGDADMHRFECLDQAQIEGIVGDHLLGVECQIPSQRWKTMLDHAWDVFLHPRFEASIWQEEKQCIMVEIETMQAYPEARLSKAFWASMYPEHPYGQHTWGTLAALQNSTVDQARTWYQDLLSQHIIYISMVGNADVQEIQDYIHDWIRPTYREVEHSLPKAVADTTPVVLNHDGDKQMMQIGYATCGADHPDRPVLEWIRHYWVNASMGVLYQRIREELGWVYGLDCFARYGVDQGCFGLFFSADPDNVPLILKEVEVFASRLMDAGPSQAEFDRMRLYLEGQRIMEMDAPTSALAYRYQHEILGVRADPWQQCEAMQAVTAQDVKRVAQTYLTQSRVEVAMSPKNN